MDTLTKGVNIFRILLETFDLDVTDSRDHVYSCLSVTDTSAKIFPDYSRSVGSVYYQWTRWFTAILGELSIIMIAGIRVSCKDIYILSSWLSDWYLYSENTK